MLGALSDDWREGSVVKSSLLLLPITQVPLLLASARGEKSPIIPVPEGIEHAFLSYEETRQTAGLNTYVEAMHSHTF